MITAAKVIEIFCQIDDFMIDYDAVIENAGLKPMRSVRLRKRKFRMFDSEIMTIMVLFHLKSYRNLKEFYSTYVCRHMQDFFPKTVSYNRFVELQKRVIQPLAVYLKLRGLGKRTWYIFY